MKSIEFRVRPVVRFIVTRYRHASQESGLPSIVDTLGEFDNEGFAVEVVAAFRAFEEQDALIPPPSDPLAAQAHS